MMDVGCIKGLGILFLVIMGGCLLCLRVRYSFAGCYYRCWLCPRVEYSFAGCYGGMLVVSKGLVFFC